MRLEGIEGGLNVVVGPNEMGKSTLLDALRAALFEKYNSKAQPIMALQNDRNQAAPVVELAFELDDGLYRITKRFIKKPYARLSCPDGRTLEGDVAEDTLRGLLDFGEPGKTGAKPETLGMWNVLWVQQGQSFGVLALPESARSSLHSALESEVGTVLGGRRGRALPQTIEKQLGELITRATSRPRGAYKELIEHVATTGQELDALRTRRQEMTQTLHDLEDAQATLKRLSTADRDEADQMELEDARQRHGQLVALEAQIEAAHTELELRKKTLEQAERAVADRMQLKIDIQTEETALQEAEVHLQGALEQEQEALSRVDALRDEIHQSRAVVTKADESVSQYRRTLGVVERQVRIHGLKKRHEKAEAAEKSQRKAQQAAAAILVTDTALGAIRKASQQLAAAQSRLDAAATLISFDMTVDSSLGIEVDGKPLDIERPFIQAVEPVTITIPDRGRIAVQPAIKNRDKLLRQQQDAEAELRQGLEKTGVKSVADAETQHAKRQKLLQDLELARQGVELHAPATNDYAAGVQALADYIEGLQQALEREMKELNLQELPGLQEAETELQVSQEQAEVARSALEAARAALSGPEDSLNVLQTEIGTLKGRHSEIERRLGKLKNQVGEAESHCSENELRSAIPEARDAKTEQEATIANLEAQRTDETLPQLSARIGRLTEALEKRREKRGELKVKIAGLKSHIEAAEGAGLDEAIALKARELERIEEDKDRRDHEVQVLRLLLSTLRNAEQAAKQQYLSPVLKRVRPYLQLLFPGADIRIDEDLTIASVVREAGHEEAFSHLSMGTQEQIAVLVRLAFAEMLVEQGCPATVVLDDALVFADDQRMNRIFDILNMASRNVQVIIFTCREQLFEGLGGRQLSLEQASSDDLISA